MPSLANPRYFTDKFSSTVITSLSTGTPIIASQRLLDAYSFLEKEGNFFQVRRRWVHAVIFLFFQKARVMYSDDVVKVSLSPTRQLGSR